MLDYTNDNYKNDVPYPSKSDYNRFYIYKQGEVIYKHLSPREFIMYGNKLLINEQLTHTSSVEAYLKNKGFITEIIVDMNGYTEDRNKYSRRAAELEDLWKVDLSNHYGIDFVNDPIGMAIFNMAYSRGHSAGRQEIDCCLGDIIEFTERVIKSVPKSKMANDILK